MRPIRKYAIAVWEMQCLIILCFCFFFSLFYCGLSGKTQLVHSCASFLGSCHVLEINTSVPRGGTSLRRIMEEATQSQSLFLSSSQQYNNNATCKEIHGYDCNKEYDGRTDIANSSSCSMPVLLLDEGKKLLDFFPPFRQQ